MNYSVKVTREAHMSRVDVLNESGELLRTATCIFAPHRGSMYWKVVGPNGMDVLDHRTRRMFNTAHRHVAETEAMTVVCGDGEVTYSED